MRKCRTHCTAKKLDRIFVSGPKTEANAALVNKLLSCGITYRGIRNNTSIHLVSLGGRFSWVAQKAYNDSNLKFETRT